MAASQLLASNAGAGQQQQQQQGGGGGEPAPLASLPCTGLLPCMADIARSCVLPLPSCKPLSHSLQRMHAHLDDLPDMLPGPGKARPCTRSSLTLVSQAGGACLAASWAAVEVAEGAAAKAVLRCARPRLQLTAAVKEHRSPGLWGAACCMLRLALERCACRVVRCGCGRARCSSSSRPWREASCATWCARTLWSCTGWRTRSRRSGPGCWARAAPPHRAARACRACPPAMAQVGVRALRDWRLRFRQAGPRLHQDRGWAALRS